MSFKKIIQDIQSGQYAPIYLLHGEESFYIDAISKTIESEVLNDGEKAFNMSVLYGKDATHKDIVDHARQYPMMASHRVVILHEAQDMRTLKQIESYVAQPAASTILVINHKYKKADARQKWVKSIKKNGIIYEAKKLYDNQVAPWITEYVVDKGYKINRDAASVLAEYVGNNLSKLTNEIDKLFLNLKEGETIDAAMVMEQVGVSKDYNVFELQNAISAKNREKAFRIAKYFQNNQKANPLPLVLASLYNYLIKVYIAAYHRKKTDKELQGLLGLSSTFFVKDYVMAARNYSSAQILEAFDLLKTADERSKGVGARNETPESILYGFLIGLMSE